MSDCLLCGDKTVKKDGVLTRQQMTKQGMRNRLVQMYRCGKGHQFSKHDIDAFTPSFIEHVVYTYLRCLSLNTTVDIIRETFERDVLSKRQVLDFIVIVADALPTPIGFTLLYHPKRSGYIAFDGVWFNYQGGQIVLMVAFDPVTFDIMAALWSSEENGMGYLNLMDRIIPDLPVGSWRGIYGDGDKGLLHAWKERVPNVPFQLCVVHKEIRMGQLVPVKSVARSHKMSEARKTEITDFQHHFQACLYGDSKKECYLSLKRLKEYVDSYPNPAFKQSYNSLKHNFAMTLTHFDHLGMERDNNILECFNGCLKPRLKLMRGFKKADNLDRYLNLFLLEYRFRPLRESRFKERRGKSPLQLAGVILEHPYNFLTYLRENLHLTYKFA